MKVKELMDILSKANPDKDVYVVDQYSCAEAKNPEIAPTGNVFIEFDNWYMKLLEEGGYLRIPIISKECCGHCIYFKNDSNMTYCSRLGTGRFGVDYEDPCCGDFKK